MALFEVFQKSILVKLQGKIRELGIELSIAQGSIAQGLNRNAKKIQTSTEIDASKQLASSDQAIFRGSIGEEIVAQAQTSLRFGHPVFLVII